MNRKTAACLLGVACLMTVGLIWSSGRSSKTNRIVTDVTTGAREARNAAINANNQSASSALRTESAISISAESGAILDRLSAATEPTSCRDTLAEFRRLLDGLPHDAASREVRALLDSRKDAPTRLDFTVKEGGALGDASSFRVFLLDYLGQIDRKAAAAVSREILRTPTSPDEWAVSLRNVAWGDDSTATMLYLRAKAGEMIANTDWRRTPSAGFLEAFDVIVHARGVDLEPQLAELVRDKDNRTLGHAAFLTLDRLTLADAVSALTPLAEKPELMEGREQTRANFFARLDVGDGSQKALLESYLLDPHRTPQELQTFVGIYPNANYMISHNLLTQTSTPSQGELAARDQTALRIIEGWIADPRFARLLPQLTTMRDRLRTFVQQAAAPPAR